MGNWRKTKIGEFLTQQKRQISIDSDIDYKLVTISNKGEVKLREVKSGATISAQKGYIAKKGDFIYSRLSVHTGAFGIVPDVLDGALITNEMPCFKIDNSKILPDILTKMIGLPDFLWQLKQLTQGMGRVRIKENMMLSLLLCLPYIEEQQKIVSHFKSIETEDGELKDELTHQQALLKKLRQQILQEAIEGKLTEDWRAQNPDVEPACELLKRIQEEKCQLIKDKKIKKQRTLPGDLPAGRQVSEDEKPFELPDGWIWCRLEDAGLFERGKSKHRPRNDETLFSKGTYPFIQTGDVAQSKRFGYKINTFSKRYNETGLSQSRLWQKGTLCITIAANIAETGFLDIDACFPDSVVGFTSLADKITSQYVKYYIDATRDEIEKFAPATAQKNINLGIINMLPFPLPPLPEQKAIVAKVEKLLALCDQLETQITTNQSHAKGLMQAVLKEAFSVPVLATTLTPQTEEEQAFVKRKMLASYIINQSLDDSHFGDTKFEKLLYLSDCFILQRNLRQQYYQKAAGPYDNKFTYSFFQQTKKAKWFKKINQNKINRIVADDNVDKSKKTYNYFSQQELEKISNLIEFFENCNYEQPEIVATLYAVWNNRIIKNEPITDKLLKADFLAWSQQKAKYKNRILPALAWMREKDIIPNGWGKLITKPIANS